MLLRDKRVVKSRRALIETGITELPQNPSATLTEIAEIAGIGRATLYRHFASREVLIEEILKVSLEDIIKALAPMDKENLRGKRAMIRGLELLLPLADRIRFMATFWVEADKVLSKDYRAEWLDGAAIEAVEQAKEDGDIRKDLPTRWIADCYDALIFSAWELVTEGEVTTDEMTALLATTFFEGVGVKPARA
ncbi:DNA-binding transcriptional regulator EnvR [Pseudovibrio axinellae]|uniref:DNA-binding transcriptional regulator EnvR n=1 Tax=Pseudovibrio axinellae TaxID=989403 RepID=A0A165Z5W8_9HYPH|nr:TetR/AcrR family transcriptional regulator [Pseudovibrio axinellae]KZL19537.1 DNA-binding transcriptional regulator EnvR [Pseudovibrio axinellae]SEQ31004.1 transcriptional regulator, TetR family [Pseudovibrio axinellae]